MFPSEAGARPSRPSLWPRLAPWAVAATCQVAAGAARAADDEATLAPVVVTAERLPGTVDKTPVSIGVVSQEDIEAKGIVQLNDLVGIIAGVSVPNGYSNMPQAVGIRGVGVSQPAMAQAVGIYVDDVPMLRGYATALWDLPDIVRWEVLKGPQGTLYGQSATAGAVKLVSAAPDEITGSWVEAGFGNLGQWEVKGLFAGALQPGLSASFAFSSRANDGFGYNATRQESINKLQATQFRTKVKVDAGAGAHVTFAIDGLLDRSDTNTINYPLNHVDAAPRVSYTASDAGDFERRAGGVSATAELPVGAGTRFRSITAYRGYTDDPTVADWGGLEIERYALTQRVRQRTFTQELQLTHTRAEADLVGGLMFVSDRFSFDRDVTLFPVAAPAPSYTRAATDQQLEDIGLYGQGHFRVAEQVSATAGLRAYWTKQDASNAFWRTNAQHVPTLQVYDAPALHTSDSGLLPRIGLDYTPSPTTFVYASIAQGQKFAGFNRAAESLASAQTAARPEKVTTYEIGTKLLAPSEGLSVNAAAFYNDYREYLASLNNTTVNGVLIPDSVFLNAGKARTWGVDVDAEKRLARGVSATASVEWLKSKYLEFANPTGAAATDYKGNELPYAPRWTAGLGLKGRTAALGGAVSADAWLQYIDGQYVDAANTEAFRVPKQTYLNFSLGFAQDGWQLELRVRNATDRTYALARNRIPALGIDTAYYNAPRTVMFNVRHDL